MSLLCKGQSMRTIAVIIALLLLVDTNQALAQCRSGRFNYGVPYQAPVYQAPAVVYEPPPIYQPLVVQEVLAPAYVFQVLNAFPQASPGPLGTMPYQGSQQQVQCCPPAQSTSVGGGTLRLDPEQLDEIVRRLKETTLQSEGGPPAFGDALTLSPRGTPRDNEQPTEEDHVAFFKHLGSPEARCAECHQAPNSKGGVVLFDEAGYWKPTKNGRQLAVETVVEAIASGSMPKGGGHVRQDLLARISRRNQPQTTYRP